MITRRNGEEIMNNNSSKGLELYQAKYHKDQSSRSILEDCEKRYTFDDEIELFANLVNFSTAKEQPYQRWVRYREGYSTLLVKELIERSGFDKGNYYIADPMMGSGSTLLAAKDIGYDSFGIDVNPYCQTIVELKLLCPDNKTIKSVENILIERPWMTAEYEKKEIEIPLMEYFPEENIIDVLRIRNWINSIVCGDVKKIVFAAWLFCLENVSNRKKDGNGLATRPAPEKDVNAYYCRILTDIIQDFQNSPLPDNYAYVKTASATDFSRTIKRYEKTTDKKLGCVIFSPPYANSFDYFESYKLELLFGGLYSIEEFNENKKKLIRNYRISNKYAITDSQIEIVEALCREIMSEVPKKEEKTGKRDGRTRLTPNMLRGYFMDMKKVLFEIYEALAPGGDCYIVVDQSAYVGVIIPTDIILALLGEMTGFTVEKISVCRKAATSGQQLRQYPYLKNTLRESIVCLKK